MRPKVVYLEDDADLRVLMKIGIRSNLGAECLSLASFAEFESHSQQILDAEIALLDINLGHGMPTGIDAYRWLKKNAFRGRIFFLTGHARGNPLLAEAAGLGAEILEKPIRPDRLFAIIKNGWPAETSP